MPEAPRVVFAAPINENHTVGVLAAAMLAAGAGLSPIYLGSGLPAREISFAARRSGARAVVMQIAGTEPTNASQVTEILQGLPSGVELWLGGRIDFPHEGALFLPDFAALEQQYQRLAAGV